MDAAPLEQPDISEVSMLGILHALADPARLRLVELLSRSGRIYCSAAVDEVGLHKSTVSHHWRVLREAGLTSTYVSGRERQIELRLDELEQRFPGLLRAVVAGAESEQEPDR